MTQEDMQKKLSELGSNTEFAEKLAACESIEKMAEVFQAEGIDVNAEMLEAALKTVAAQHGEGELSEEALEGVSGGILFSSLCAALVCSIGVWHCCNLILWKLNK